MKGCQTLDLGLGDGPNKLPATIILVNSVCHITMVHCHFQYTDIIYQGHLFGLTSYMFDEDQGQESYTLLKSCRYLVK